MSVHCGGVASGAGRFLRAVAVAIVVPQQKRLRGRRLGKYSKTSAPVSHPSPVNPGDSLSHS